MGFLIFIIVKRILILFFGISLSLALDAQQNAPSYIEVIKKFCSNYEPSEDHEHYTAFAKKKKGWYVLQVNRQQNDRVLEERLFYSFADRTYLNLSKHYATADEVDIDEQLEKYLTAGGSTGDWYGYERIPYYGYNGWYIDVIKEFGKQELLSDTLYDALGRAYLNLATTYLWYQNGGMYPEYDTLHRRLGRLEYPSRERINKVKEAIDSAIIQFAKLKAINPVYKTIIGNSNIKLFNEYLHGYNLMVMCGDEVLAREYIDRASLDEPYIQQAKNFLNSCDPNAILFTYGDNDTYQLWYLQEKYNYRKDVLVINTSLLGLPVYIDMFKRKKMLSVSIPDSFLLHPESDVVYHLKHEKITAAKKTVPLQQFLKIIYNKQYPYTHPEMEEYATYPYTSASISYRAFGKNMPDSGLQRTISFDLHEVYYLINDIAVFDMVLNNLSRRPIYFTATQNPFEKKLMQKGIVYKLVLQNLSQAVQDELEIKGLEKYITDTYIPVLSNDTGLLTFDGDNSFFGLHYRLFQYYHEKKDTANLKKWLRKLEVASPKINSSQIPAARRLVFFYLEAGETEKGLAIAKQYIEWMHQVYSEPHALAGYYFPETYVSELTKLRDYLASKDLSMRLLNDLLNE